ncbi:hypothetical protein K7711_09430 [Nocardia sp. CA2R105]|uniref:hypothetical protein n=1 Tax=Nocardia coffeae TaxID=2873381 RepID=UPI001CA6CF71|nr:hypothetical protein [Nocardia coffeae]MBY8856695.1 hypothetical protein [Nocardia coffeae]
MTGTTHHAYGNCTCSDRPTRRVIVYFENPGATGGLVLEYAATYTEACEFASAAVRSGLAITVDRKIRPDLRPLPCRRLWR